MKTYNLVEVQSWNNGTSAVPAGLGYKINDGTEAADTATAKAAFYSKCAVAVKSDCDIHTVMLLDGEANVVDGCKQTFYHGHEVEEEE